MKRRFKGAGRRFRYKNSVNHYGDGAVVGDPTGESNGEALRLDFDRRLMLGFMETLLIGAEGSAAGP
jgi:hypothetical protein